VGYLVSSEEQEDVPERGATREKVDRARVRARGEQSIRLWFALGGMAVGQHKEARFNLVADLAGFHRRHSSRATSFFSSWNRRRALAHVWTYDRKSQK
jgi:hypothetical protein